MKRFISVQLGVCIAATVDSVRAASCSFLVYHCCCCCCCSSCSVLHINQSACLILMKREKKDYERLCWCWYIFVFLVFLLIILNQVELCSLSIFSIHFVYTLNCHQFTSRRYYCCFLLSGNNAVCIYVRSGGLSVCSVDEEKKKTEWQQTITTTLYGSFSYFVIVIINH